MRVGLRDKPFFGSGMAHRKRQTLEQARVRIKKERSEKTEDEEQVRGSSVQGSSVPAEKAHKAVEGT